jgi:hypothetical protein
VIKWVLIYFISLPVLLITYILLTQYLTEGNVFSITTLIQETSEDNREEIRKLKSEIKELNTLLRGDFEILHDKLDSIDYHLKQEKE